MSRLGAVFDTARSERRAAFVGYLTAGDPNADATIALARALERAGTDVLELGVPFSDPIADGPVLQRAASRALAAGTTLQHVFAIAKRIRAETRIALVLFTYANPVHRMGFAETARRAAAAGFDGVLLTDVPPEEAAPLLKPFRRNRLDTILLASPTSTPARMRQAARLSSGFLYVVSRTGTTGARDGLPKDLPATVNRARAASGELPIAIGFGISRPASASHAARLADGVVVGSALVRAAEEAGHRRGDTVAAVETLARCLVRSCRRNTRA